MKVGKFGLNKNHLNQKAFAYHVLSDHLSYKDIHLATPSIYTTKLPIMVTAIHTWRCIKQNPVVTNVNDDMIQLSSSQYLPLSGNISTQRITWQNVWWPSWHIKEYLRKDKIKICSGYKQRQSTRILGDKYKTMNVSFSASVIFFVRVLWINAHHSLCFVRFLSMDIFLSPW